MNTTETPERKLYRDYREIKQDFAFDPSIFNDEPDRVRRVKQIIAEELDPVDRVLILMYIDCGSLRKLGRRLNVSHVTINKEIRRIRQTIIDKI